MQNIGRRSIDTLDARLAAREPLPPLCPADAYLVDVCPAGVPRLSTETLVLALVAPEDVRQGTIGWKIRASQGRQGP
jgi:hypothetical protein